MVPKSWDFIAKTKDEEGLNCNKLRLSLFSSRHIYIFGNRSFWNELGYRKEQMNEYL